MGEAKLSDRIVSFCGELVSWMRGGIGCVCVIANMIFAALTGSGAASISAIGGLVTPELKKAGYKPGRDVMFAMDAAASELYDEEKGCYWFAGEDTSRTSDEMIDYYTGLVKRFNKFFVIALYLLSLSFPRVRLSSLRL